MRARKIFPSRKDFSCPHPRDPWVSSGKSGVMGWHPAKWVRGCVGRRRVSFFVVEIMSVLPILRYPDPKLREKSQDVTFFDAELRRLVSDMGETMYAAEGAGLAAIQVGVPLRLFIIDALV